jgi:hypothetical protein
VSIAPLAAAPIWTLAYRHDCRTLDGVQIMQSPRLTNDKCAPDDTSNSELQKPTLASNVEVVNDPAATDGQALAIRVRPGTYTTSLGLQTGWTMGRMALPFQAAPPVRVRARLRMSRAVGTKLAVMWWPAGGGWPWEVDFAEVFGGLSLSDYWGSRQYVGQRWHADLDGNGMATEQLLSNRKHDATKYTVYELTILPGRMSVRFNGVEAFATTDRRFIPTDAGFFALGTALTGRRDARHTADATFLDYVEVYTG